MSRSSGSTIGSRRSFIRRLCIASSAGFPFRHFSSTANDSTLDRAVRSRRMVAVVTFFARRAFTMPATVSSLISSTKSPDRCGSMVSSELR